MNAPTKPKSEGKKKRKGGAKDSTSNHDIVSHDNKKSSKAHPKPKLNNGFNTDVEESDDNRRPKAKKQKTSTGDAEMPQALRRTGKQFFFIFLHEKC